MKQSTWPCKTAVLVSQNDTASNTLRQSLRQKGWELADRVPTLHQALKEIRNGGADCICVEDSPSLPAGMVLREMALDPVGLLTPVACLVSEQHLGDYNAIAKVGYTAAIQKPLTFDSFNNSFNRLIAVWERKQFVPLRTRMRPLLHSSDGLKTFATKAIKMMALDEISPLVAPALAQIYFRNQRLKEAETILLGQIKKGGNNLLSIIVLGHIYMHSAMPHLAHRLFQNVQQQFRGCLFILADLAQAKLMNEELEEAALLLKRMAYFGYMGEQTEEALCKLYLAMNDSTSAKSSLKSRPGLFRKFAGSWDSILSRTVPAHVPIGK